LARNAHADALLTFLAESPTSFHAAAQCALQLHASGAKELRDEQPWQLQTGEAAYLLRGGGTLLAFRAPKRIDSKNLRFHLVGAHTDSPGLKLKPRPVENSQGYRQWGVEIYGGVLFNSWLDRDLGIAGRLVHCDQPEAPPLLVRLNAGPIRIPQLAIHLDRQVNEQGLVLNPQRHLIPVLGQVGGGSLESLIESKANAPFNTLAFDLFLYDQCPPTYGGLNQEFIYSARLDNLAMTHAALLAFLAAEADDHAVQVIALFDHEEVGSGSARGADSTLLLHALERIALGLGLDRDAFLATLPRSFLLSADMAHALHPNYPEKHEPAHFPLMNRGPVLKQNASQRYASDATTAARFLAAGRRAGIPIQHFINRADLGCGSTIGPILAAGTGIPTVDAGNAMLSMHSCREMCGADDHGDMVTIMREILAG
jgi:aspartyl aminopeptidase